MIERRIKELSIALEALSRIQGYMASCAFDNVGAMLTKLIDEAKEKPTATNTQTNASNLDDEIPF